MMISFTMHVFFSLQITCDFRVRSARPGMFVDFLRRLNSEGRRWLEIVPDPVPVFLSHHVVFFTGIDLGGCEDCCNVRRRLRSVGSAAAAAAGRKRAMDEYSAGDCSTTDELQDDVMHKVHIQLHSGQDAIRIQVHFILSTSTSRMVDTAND